MGEELQRDAGSSSPIRSGRDLGGRARQGGARAQQVGTRPRGVEAGRIADAEGTPIALIVQPPARRALAALLKTRCPRCLVLSIAELPASQPIAVVGVIGGADDGPTLAAPDVPELAA